MTIRINDTLISIPKSQDEFTIGRRADFHRQHGVELDKLVKRVSLMTDDEDKKIFERHCYFESMFRSFSFFSGVPVDVLKNCEFIDEIGKIYHMAILPLFEEPEETEPQQTFHWLGEEWVLPPVELSQSSKMKFGEFIDAKQAVKDIVANGGSRWDYTIPIAAIYLRKKGEKYREEFMYPESERLKMLEELPLPIALQVGFFLTVTTSSSTNTFQFSISPEQKGAVNTSRPITTCMGGSIF